MAPWSLHGVSRGQVDVPGARSTGRRSHGVAASTWLIAPRARQAASGSVEGGDLGWALSPEGEGAVTARAWGEKWPPRRHPPGGARRPVPQSPGETERVGSGPARPGGDGGSSMRGWQARVDGEHREGRGRTGARAEGFTEQPGRVRRTKGKEAWAQWLFLWGAPLLQGLLGFMKEEIVSCWVETA